MVSNSMDPMSMKVSPRGKAIVGEVDPLMSSSLPLSSIRGSSYTDLFKAAQFKWIMFLVL